MGTYYFIKSQLSGYVVDIPGASTKAKAPLDVFTQTANADNQLWQFVSDPAGSGYCFIMSKLNGNVIDISGASPAPKTPLDAYPLNVTSYDNQLWEVVGGSFPKTVPTVPAPAGGLGSNCNYLLSDGCKPLTGVSVTIDVFAGITGSDGFGFQLSAYSAKGDYDAAQQYLIYLSPSSSPAQLTCMVDNRTASNSQIVNDQVELATLPSHTLPDGYKLRISLENDSAGNITGATYVATDNLGNTMGSHTITLPSQDLAPIVAFQVDFVDYLNGGTTVLSSGAGAITYVASNQLTAQSATPACVDWNYITVEKANSSYGWLASNPNQKLTQTFQKAAAAVKDLAPRPGTVLHKTSARAGTH